MRFVLAVVTLLREWAQKLGPYLLLEILLPGGTLLAVLLLLYRRRSQFLPLRSSIRLSPVTTRSEP